MRKFEVSQIAARISERYAENAAEIAKLQAEALFQQGDGEGYSNWLRVIALIDAMQVAEPKRQQT